MVSVLVSLTTTILPIGAFLMDFKLKYLVIPDFLYSDNRLNAIDLKIYAFLNSYKGDKFYFSNDQLMEMFNTSEDSITRGITRLVEFGYIQADYEIKSGGGKVRFLKNLKSADSDSANLRIGTPQKSGVYIKENKLKENNKYPTDISSASSPDSEWKTEKSSGIKSITPHPTGEFLVAGSRSPNRKKPNSEITGLIEFFKSTLGLEMLDGTPLQNRRFAHSALKKFGRSKLNQMIFRVRDDEFWHGKITSMEQLFRKGVMLLQVKETKTGKQFESERSLDKYEKYG